MTDPTVGVTEPTPCVSWFQALDDNGQPAVGLTFQIRLVRIATGLPVQNNQNISYGWSPSPGFALQSDTVTAVSDANGIVRFTATYFGCVYEVRLQGSPRKKRFECRNLTYFQIPAFIW